MKTYMAVKSEIAKLVKHAENLRKREIKGVVTQIRKAIVEYGLTATDLGFGGKARVSREAAARPKRGKGGRKSVGTAKYRDPASGQTWTGHGRPPAWIANAKNRDDYLIDAAAATPAPARKKRAAKKSAPAA